MLAEQAAIMHSTEGKALDFKKKIIEFADAKILIVRIVSAVNFVTELRQKIQRGQRGHIAAFESFIYDLSYQLP